MTLSTNDMLKVYDPKTLTQILEDLQNSEGITEIAIFTFTGTETGCIATEPKNKKGSQYKAMENLLKTLLSVIKTREWDVIFENVEKDVKYFISTKDNVILCIAAEGRANSALLSVEVKRAMKILTEKR